MSLRVSAPVTAAAGLLAILVMSAGTIHPSAALAAPKPIPIPGGANQQNGVSGTMASTLFNGTVRVKTLQFRTSTPAEATAPAGGSAITLTYIISSGTSSTHGAASAMLADADGVTLKGSPVGIYGAYYDLAAGEAKRGAISFTYDSSYKPVKLLLSPATGPLFRITLKPADLPAAPIAAPAAAATP